MVVIARLHSPGSDGTASDAGNADVLLRQMFLCNAQQLPLGILADDATKALFPQPVDLLAQELARGEMKWRSGYKIFVAENPSHARRPRQHAKSRGIGNDGQIGRAGHLIETHPA